jgi:hypothetical protein
MSSLSSTTAERAGRPPRAVARKAAPEKVSARMRITHLVSYSLIPFLPTAHCSQTEQKCHRTGMRFCADVGIRCRHDDAAHVLGRQSHVPISSGVIIRIWWSPVLTRAVDGAAVGTGCAGKTVALARTAARAARKAGAYMGDCVIDADTCVSIGQCVMSARDMPFVSVRSEM